MYTVFVDFLLVVIGFDFILVTDFQTCLNDCMDVVF